MKKDNQKDLIKDVEILEGIIIYMENITVLGVNIEIIRKPDQKTCIKNNSN